MFHAVYDAALNGNPTPFSVHELQEVVTKHLCARQIAACVKRVKRRDDVSQDAVAGAGNGEGPSKCMEWLHAKGVIESANKKLRERGFIEASEGGTGHYEVTLKLAGRDLGCKYNS